MSARASVFCLAAVAASLLPGCGSVTGAGDRVLRISGSDTMLVLNRRLAEGYMRRHAGVSIVVDGGGTTAGFEALVAGRVEVCAASRPLTADEIRRLYDRYGTLGVRFPIAQDGVSVWVHESNPVSSLSTAQLRAIFSGDVTNWRQVGGDDREIVTVVRPPASGTHRLFRDRVLMGGVYGGVAAVAPATTQVLQRVADDPAAIGYGGLAYERAGVRICPIDGVVPSARTLSEGRYPLARHLTHVTAAPPRGLARTFIDWCQGPDGQSLVAEVGYLPLWRRP